MLMSDGLIAFTSNFDPVRYFLEISYNGAAYSGWQVQPNGLAVQEVMDRSLSTIVRDTINCVGCGRTDAGVHARQFFLHFQTENSLPDDFLHRMNAILPDDIAAHQVIEVHPNAHARFDATSRSYEYIFCNRKDVFRKGFVFYKPFFRLNREIMEDACGILLKYDDFPTFCKAGAGSKTTKVNLQHAKWEERGDDLVFRISANRFLRGMVRLIVGAMIQLGEGKMGLDEFESTIQQKARFRLALSAPAHGLYLSRLEYPYLQQDPKLI